MSTQLQLRRGTTVDHATFTGAEGEVTYNTQTKRLHTHDGSTPSGDPVALQSDLSDLALKTDIPTSFNTTSIKAAEGSYDLALGDQYLRVDGGSGTAIINVPADATTDFPIGTQISMIWVNGVLAYIAPDSGVTILHSDTLTFRKIGSSAVLTKVAANSWDLAGDMQVS